MGLTQYFISMVLGFNLISIAHAHEESHNHQHNDEHRYHDVHVHGMATLDMVLDDDVLMIHLQSPLMNFLGFEHAPQTEFQKQIYQAMIQRFKKPDTLLTVEGARCEAESIEINEPFSQQDEAEHTDIEISYFLRCTYPANITGLQINLFDLYNRLETIHVQLVLPNRQQKLVLNPQRTTIRVN